MYLDEGQESSAAWRSVQTHLRWVRIRMESAAGSQKRLVGQMQYCLTQLSAWRQTLSESGYPVPDIEESLEAPPEKGQERRVALVACLKLGSDKAETFKTKAMLIVCVPGSRPECSSRLASVGRMLA